MRSPRASGRGQVNTGRICKSLGGDKQASTPTGPEVQRHVAAYAGRFAPQYVQQLQRECAQLHSLGPRILFEFLRELADRLDADDALNAMLANYRRLTPEVAFVVGADRFPPLPLRAVPR